MKKDRVKQSFKEKLKEIINIIKGEIELKVVVPIPYSIGPTNKIQVPDPSLDVDILNFIMCQGLFPLSKERALELYNKGLQIFAIYPDCSSRATVVNSKYFERHIGYFGINHYAWETFLQLGENPYEKFALSAEEEKACVESSEVSYAIYQLKSGAEFRDYRFASVKELESTGKEIDLENYDLIYTGELQNVESVESVNHALDCLYHDFYQYKPDNFKGHSLSVSDIIAIGMNGKVSYHYIDKMGFKELEDYLQIDEFLFEEDQNYIDDIIYNGPIVGKIDYYGYDGKVVETMKYTDKAEFEKHVKDNNYYGVPMSVKCYGETSLSASIFDPPILGFKIEPESLAQEYDANKGKSDLIEETLGEKQQNQSQVKKEYQSHSRDIEMER